jgi:hypothetical protein
MKNTALTGFHFTALLRLISLTLQIKRRTALLKMTHLLDALFARYRQRVKPPATIS